MDLVSSHWNSFAASRVSRVSASHAASVATVHRAFHSYLLQQFPVEKKLPGYQSLGSAVAAHLAECSNMAPTRVHYQRHMLANLEGGQVQAQVYAINGASWKASESSCLGILEDVVPSKVKAEFLVPVKKELVPLKLAPVKQELKEEPSSGSFVMSPSMGCAPVGFYTQREISATMQEPIDSSIPDGQIGIPAAGKESSLPGECSSGKVPLSGPELADALADPEAELFGSYATSEPTVSLEYAPIPMPKEAPKPAQRPQAAPLRQVGLSKKRRLTEKSTDKENSFAQPTAS